MTPFLSLDKVAAEIDGRLIVNDVSLAARPGEFIGLVGPNGAGKSTLLKVIAGLLRPVTGRLLLNNRELSDLPPRERARMLSYLPQARPVFWSVTARDVISLGRFAYGAPLNESSQDSAAVEKALRDADASQMAGRPVSELSGGELARVHLARMLAGETSLLLADEPIAALDPAHQFAVMTLLRKKAGEGCAVIAALHELSLAARYCTRLIVLNSGMVAGDGAPKDILTPELLRTVFGVEASIANAGGEPELRLAPLDETQV
ncbi:ABC transporter ATP-binding protein [Hyphococcus sp.]|uniref:ABC transporter ATP-binding protein n=1 Tax=Hyphococcus sp. TaxID=2038636 RepID=UPI003CCB9503